MASNSRRATGPYATAGGNRNSILKTLQATEISDTKTALPAEIFATIIDYLPIPDLMRFARTSRRMCEMVYDDTRWVARLMSMGCWDEVEARRRFEEAVVRRRREAVEAVERARVAAAAGGGSEAGIRVGAGPEGVRGHGQPNTTLFDASAEEKRTRQLQVQMSQKSLSDVRNGFETLKVGGGNGGSIVEQGHQDPDALLMVLQRVRSARGFARQEYGKIYGALAPFYLDLARARTHTDPAIFRVFKDPERQARMLANLHVFTRSDWASGWQQREEKLTAMMGLFESAVLREFEQGFDAGDVEGRMRRYAHVLDSLNGGTAGVNLFVQNNVLFSDTAGLAQLVGKPMDCLTQAPPGKNITLEPTRRLFEGLARKVDEQARIMERVFPRPGRVFWAFLDKVRDDVIMEYATPLFDEAHERHVPAYLQAVSGVFEQTLHFFRTLTSPNDLTPEENEAKSLELALAAFEPHLDLYLQEELDQFTKRACGEVDAWGRQLSEQDASVMSMYMSGFANRQADKKDFLTSFKKVVMTPVTVLPTLPTTLGLPLSTPFGGVFLTKSTASSVADGGLGSQPQSPGTNSALDRKSSPMPSGKGPTDELAAKAALVASRLEGMRSLFSIEVALSLVHAAKSSLGRAAVFIQLGGQAGEEAREQCGAIFVALLQILGNRHVKPGFDKAVEHLSQYNPRQHQQQDPDQQKPQQGVAPLVTFIELVNVGDLISQMIDVFYEQQLTGPRIADRNDFLDPAGLAKKKFEQMLDESVAAGLNKGIDVLMDEVEFICATTQRPTDYNPVGSGSDGSLDSTATPSNGSCTPLPSHINKRASLTTPLNIGPTPTARRVRDLVASHTSMLIGSTDKSTLDVFNGEVAHRLFTALCKHLKRQRISTEGAISLIADMNLYFEYARSLRNGDLLPYFRALRELSQIYLIDAKQHAGEMAVIIADGDRWAGVFRAEEVYEFAERRADWYVVRRNVERAMYGLECCTL